MNKNPWELYQGRGQKSLGQARRKLGLWFGPARKKLGPWPARKKMGLWFGQPAKSWSFSLGIQAAPVAGAIAVRPTVGPGNYGQPQLEIHSKSVRVLSESYMREDCSSFMSELADILSSPFSSLLFSMAGLAMCFAALRVEQQFICKNINKKHIKVSRLRFMF